jgi:hypothetical protein
MSVRFDAQDDVYSASTGLPAGTTWTVSFWAMLVVDRNADSNLFTLNGGSDGAFIGTEVDGTNLTLTSFVNSVGGTALTVNTWYRIAATLSGTAANFYVGVAGGALTTTSGTLSSATPVGLSIGSAGAVDPTQWWNGRIASFKLWDAVLTSTEIAVEFTQNEPVRRSNLLRYHPFHGADTADYSGNGNTLTAGATAASTEDGPPICPSGRVSRPFARPRAANF